MNIAQEQTAHDLPNELGKHHQDGSAEQQIAHPIKPKQIDCRCPDPDTKTVIKTLNGNDVVNNKKDGTASVSGSPG
ncbi:hypothetical protein GWI33_001782 [Rhynchophorus ferrugineus]|uniref:Uncharacterized protein n=1 Tax=Rhynchophorus ferrugineus TaxID=354439 RepID=A0A834IRV3_RHYFE|nr:hypothetical protein GWI33_001782 [Rhynchophorus ferrugineus]